MNIPSVFWLVPIASIVALGMAWFFFTQMMKEDEGTPRMKEIALYVRKGAMAYLWQQYKVVGIVFVVLCALFAFMAYGLNVQNPWVPFAFLTGGIYSKPHCGMLSRDYCISVTLLYIYHLYIPQKSLIKSSFLTPMQPL